MNKKSNSVIRRMTVGIAAVATAGMALAGCSGTSDGAAGGDEKVTMVVSVREVAGAYHSAWVAGAQAFADSVGAEMQVLVSGDDSQNQLTQIQSLLTSTTGPVIINMDPNTPSILQATVKAVEQNENAYLVAQWNKPDELKPWDATDRWVSFINYDGVDAGYQTAKTLFDSIGGSGGVVAIQGITDNTSNQLRYEGFQKALGEYPDIQLLDTQPADWDQAKALNVMKTFIAKSGDQIAGVWAADDGMALGAASAVEAEGLAIPTVSAAGGTAEAFDLIGSGGGVIATTDPDPYWQGGAGMALGYYAAMGDLDVTKLTHEQRSFYASQELVTPENVEAYTSGNTPEKYLEDFQLKNIFSRIVGESD